MPAERITRRSRRLSRRSPINLADYGGIHEDSPVADHFTSLNGGSNSSSGIAIPIPLPFSPSPPMFSTNASDVVPSLPSPNTMVTHLPFTPGSSHTRNRRKGHIPRPPNAFMVFRSWLWNKNDLKNVERDNRNVSRIAGSIWRDFSDEQRAPFRKMAEETKMRHAQLYPEYKYTPSFRKAKKSPQRPPKRRREGSKKKTRVAVSMVPQAALHASPMIMGFPAAEINIKQESPPMPELRTPDLMWPLEELEEFVPTDDIPLLTLDDCCDTTPEMPEFCPLPRYADPAVNSALCGVKPEAALFVDECMLTAFNSYSSPPSTSPFMPLEQSESSTHDDFSWGSSSPSHSPIVFSNPFKNTGYSSDPQSSSLVTLDQLFDQSISPITPIPPHVNYW